MRPPARLILPGREMAGIKYSFGASEVGLGYKYLAVQPNGLQTVGNNTFMLCYSVHF